MKRLVNPKISLWRTCGLILALGVILLAGTNQALAQCALCRDAVASSSSETREAMNYAIIGLAFTPYGVAAIAACALSPELRARLRAWLRRSTAGRNGDRL